MRRLSVIILLFPFAAPVLACPEIGVLPPTPNEFELQFGTTNTNAALGNGGLTATLSRCGEITSLKWPGPSYYNQLSYLTDNQATTRLEPHFGALDEMGAFPGIFYRTASGAGFTWLRDDAWTHDQRYSAETSDVAVTEMTNTTLGLHVTAWNFILPDRDVLVNHYEVHRLAGSPVQRAKMIFYTNFDPTMNRLAAFPVADWGLDFQNDFAVVYDHHERALLHFVPANQSYPRDFTVVNQLLRHPPDSRRGLLRAARDVSASLTDPGVYLAVGAGPRDNGFQCGFDDADICAHQSATADRTITAFQLPPDFDAVARALFVCSRIVTNPDGPLGSCRDSNAWTYAAESAYRDAADGRLSGSPIAACQANAALARRLRFRDDVARATFYVAAAATRDQAFELLRTARASGASADTQRDATEAWWNDFLAPAKLPDTDDAEIRAFARRSLIVMRTATDNASGGIVASVNTQPPYGEDWPRDGAFINYALDLAGYTDMVSRHNRFYARVQRKEPAGWSILYDFPPCDPLHLVYPNCVPAGTYEINYYTDPAATVPGNPISFEIDEAGLGVWTMWDHHQHLSGPAAAQYLTDICPSIRLGAVNLAACKDPSNNLQCLANEDDNIPLSQGLQGAETVLLALRSAISAAPSCAFDSAEVDAWRTRAAELEAAIQDHFLVSTPSPHFEGERPAWMIWPLGFFPPNDARMLSHAGFLRARAIDPIITRTAVRGAYNAEELLALAQLARERGDTAALAESQQQVKFFIHNLTTKGTLHLSESYGLVDVDLNGDGVKPDYWPENDVPHVWEHAYLYSAAMVAFGSR